MSRCGAEVKAIGNPYYKNGKRKITCRQDCSGRLETAPGEIPSCLMGNLKRRNTTFVADIAETNQTLGLETHSTEVTETQRWVAGCDASQSDQSTLILPGYPRR